MRKVAEHPNRFKWQLGQHHSVVPARVQKQRATRQIVTLLGEHKKTKSHTHTHTHTDVHTHVYTHTHTHTQHTEREREMRDEMRDEKREKRKKRD
jgi:hypothetical protein